MISNNKNIFLNSYFVKQNRLMASITFKLFLPSLIIFKCILLINTFLKTASLQDSLKTNIDENDSSMLVPTTTIYASISCCIW